MRSCFSALSISFSNSCSSSLLDSLNSASSDSSCSYCALYQLRVSSAVASAPGGDEGGSEAMTDSSDRVSRWFGSIGFAWVWFGSGREPRYGVGGDDGVGGWGWGDKIGWSKRKRTEQRRRLFVCRLCLSTAQRPSRPFAGPAEVVGIRGLPSKWNHLFLGRQPHLPWILPCPAAVGVSIRGR